MCPPCYHFLLAHHKVKTGILVGVGVGVGAGVVTIQQIFPNVDAWDQPSQSTPNLRIWRVPQPLFSLLQPSTSGKVLTTGMSLSRISSWPALWNYWARPIRELILHDSMNGEFLSGASITSQRITSRILKSWPWTKQGLITTGYWWLARAMKPHLSSKSRNHKMIRQQ